ncbi:type II toxin-antitoxin system VapC family toxin [Leptolyngbya sp. NK1-12]|uniref:Type II toxin-antitoxin system VapC family toxin n=1 Tax=Leptolyngbya sp. NK1-12 TaxID=2547451 RepID=A0AA96WD77_9CYAN|nr:type II toxin-antitoxin system VapC family toxin [Leptolyngbya sp. NK1-12]WNZ23093.1 type II toxin-antitoxin system VapC family toxin [Leptolyngbya sp. NK1-12]
MNSILTEWVALDTNQFIFALCQDPAYPACEVLLFDQLHKLNIYMPLQVLIELQRNLTSDEMRGIFLALNRAKAIRWDYVPASLEAIARWRSQGAKKGDAVIVAHLEAASIKYLVSENRHFLKEVANLPFQVLSSVDIVQILQ